MQWGGGGGGGETRGIMGYGKMVKIEKRKDPGDEVRNDSQPNSKFESSSLFKKIIVFKRYRKMWFPGASMTF